jgi:hypothetical protein
MLMLFLFFSFVRGKKKAERNQRGHKKERKKDDARPPARPLARSLSHRISIPRNQIEKKSEKLQERERIQHITTISLISPPISTQRRTPLFHHE